MNLLGDPWLFYAQLLFAAILMIAVARTARRDGLPLQSWRSMQMLGIVAAALVAAVAVNAPAASLVDAAAKRPILAVSLGVFVAANLYLLRRWNRIVFGAAEIAFSLATFVVIARGPDSISGTSAVAFFGAVYVLVRGLTNIEEGGGSKPTADTSPQTPRL